MANFLVSYVGFGKVFRIERVEADDEFDAIRRANERIEQSDLDFAEKFKLFGLEKRTEEIRP
jgi:hypothetical protein